MALLSKEGHTICDFTLAGAEGQTGSGTSTLLEAATNKQNPVSCQPQFTFFTTTLRSRRPGGAGGAHQVDLGSTRFQSSQSRAPPFPRPRLVRARGADGSGTGAEPGAPLHSHSGERNRGNGGGGAAAPRGGGERGKSSRAPFSPRAPGARLPCSDLPSPDSSPGMPADQPGPSQWVVYSSPSFRRPSAQPQSPA